MNFTVFFWMFSPLVRTFENRCPSLLIVDRTHLLGKYPEVFLVAYVLDDIVLFSVHMTSTAKEVKIIIKDRNVISREDNISCGYNGRL